MADITGTPGNDILLGNDLEGDFITALAGVDKINGGMGGDYIFAGDGNDTADGSFQRDFIQGEAGDDTLNGNSGNDYVDGGTGKDKLNGGSGQDTLVRGHAGNGGRRCCQWRLRHRPADSRLFVIRRQA
ncbi:hypothetical protein LP421_20705 [Rhizobium sp. RCAM05350]|nr:hypothetical protein LP421_20705 [Rhizobium sp. RCAM05350]